MGFITHDLECTECGTIEIEVFYRRGSGQPACVECGSETKVCWASGRAPIGRTFQSIDLGYTQCHSQKALDAEVTKIKERFPGRSVVIEGRDDAANKRSAEARFHSAHEKRKAQGLDTTIMNEHKAARKTVEREAATKALKSNSNPATAAKAASMAFGSPAKAVGGVGQ